MALNFQVSNENTVHIHIDLRDNILKGFDLLKDLSRASNICLKFTKNSVRLKRNIWENQGLVMLPSERGEIFYFL